MKACLRVLRHSHAARHCLSAAMAAAWGLLIPFSLWAQDLGAPECALKLSVELTPDVPHPGDAGFVSSLLGNHTEYLLSLRRVVDDTHLSLELEGPGPPRRCEAVVDSMRNDSRVQSIQSIQSIRVS